MPRGPSLTAEWVCLLRALERSRPEPQRILDDPLAVRFLRPSLRLVLRGLAAPTTRRLLPGELGYLPTGLFADFVAARHRYIDDALVAAVGSGIRQVVLLGAGYDTRAWRFAAILGDRPVWELDFPPTQARKRRILAQQRDLRQDRVRFVPVDFANEDFAERLVAAGFERGHRTLFIWEGVSMYLDEGTVAHTLRVLHALGGPGSVAVADYWHAPLGHPAWVTAQRFGARLFGAIGEPLRFQLDRVRAEAFLARHGFHLDERVGSKSLAVRAPLSDPRDRGLTTPRGGRRPPLPIDESHDE